MDSVIDIRRGDHFTWNGQGYLAIDDARPSGFFIDNQESIAVCCVLAKNIEPGPDGVIDLGSRLRGNLSLGEQAKIEITKRGSRVTWLGDEPRAQTPQWQARGVLHGIVTARRAAQRAVDDLDVSRDNAIRQALASEVPVSQIAEMTGLSRSRIYQIRDSRR